MDDQSQRGILKVAKAQLDMCNELRKLAKGVEVLVAELEKWPRPVASPVPALGLTRTTGLSPAKNQRAHTALIVGGDYRGDWAPLVKALYMAKVTPSYISDDLNQIGMLREPGSFDLLFLSTRIDPIHSYAIQGTLRRLYPAALLVGVASDPERPRSSEQRVVTINGFDELISPTAESAEIQSLIDRQEAHVHAIQFYQNSVVGAPVFGMDAGDQLAPSLFFLSPDPGNGRGSQAAYSFSPQFPEVIASMDGSVSDPELPEKRHAYGYD